MIPAMKTRLTGSLFLTAGMLGFISAQSLYHAIVRRQIVRVFVELGQGKPEIALSKLTPDFEHRFAGDHPLGGMRHSRRAMEQWFERLYRLFPGLHFTIKRVAVSGPPWDTTAVIEWHDQAALASGGSYDNDGVHVVRLRWGKLASLHAYPDTARVAAAIRQMAEQGVEEGRAPQIEDEPPSGVPDGRTRRGLGGTGTLS